jgi:predicted nicotinamide N-methyase
MQCVKGIAVMVPEKNTREAFGVTILTSQHKDIRRLKREVPPASIHGNKFWGASYLMMDYLQNNPPSPGSKILELGCGWGIAGIHCAKYYQAQVTGLDADDSVFPYLHLHADHNQVAVHTRKQRFEQLTKKQLSEFDVIIGADICFWDELADTVFDLIKLAIEAGVKTIAIADPERPPFFDLATRCIEQYFAELEDYAVETPKRASGCVLVVENA